ncbi:hypothetical protein [Actinoplanes aureus]|uniref:Uncharacterized protein n=1 Tax=Actinoplanes aureus TaxID=2792083 RepID=A0A931CJN6_9ACTN|nr:hypothetical protein [Actinoplanes aureus]MBG0567641.1 hypothetical protein [Actinoplanes aureus]
MERGPLALFGAIVAIGLGPALWLGAQLGTVKLAPDERPATVGEQVPDTGTELDFGGAGAGDSPETADPVTRYPIPPADSRTLRTTTKSPADPVVEFTPSRSVSPSASPSISEPAPSPSVSPSAPSADPEPSGPPTGDDPDVEPTFPQD